MQGLKARSKVGPKARSKARFNAGHGSTQGKAHSKPWQGKVPRRGKALQVPKERKGPKARAKARQGKGPRQGPNAKQGHKDKPRAQRMVPALP
jgi:hypothetical protein